MKFFFDNCLPPALPRLLCALEEEAVHLVEKYRADTPDEDWLPAIAQQGYVIISSDSRIYLKQRQMLRASRATCCFFLSKTFPRLGKWEQVWRLMKYWPSIMKEAAGAPPGAFFFVQLNGKIESKD